MTPNPAGKGRNRDEGGLGLSTRPEWRLVDPVRAEPQRNIAATRRARCVGVATPLNVGRVLVWMRQSLDLVLGSGTSLGSITITARRRVSALLPCCLTGVPGSGRRDNPISRRRGCWLCIWPLASGPPIGAISLAVWAGMPLPTATYSLLCTAAGDHNGSGGRRPRRTASPSGYDHRDHV